MDCYIPTNLSTARNNVAGSGTSTLGVVMGGSNPGATAATEEFTAAGTALGAWSTEANLNTARTQIAGGGPVTDAVATGGNVDGSGTPTNKTELWNGTSWTEVNNLNTARGAVGVAASSSTSALAFGGTVNPGNSSKALTESWNGTSWTEVADLATARYDGNGNGTALLALYSGGGTSASGSTTTEEWTVPATVTNKTITD